MSTRAGPIYLDNNATTPVDSRVLEAMMPALTETWGNASSRDHAFGWRAADAVETARRHVSDFINASPAEIIFTSGATESINCAVHDDHLGFQTIITSPAEHDAVTAACRNISPPRSIVWTNCTRAGVPEIIGLGAQSLLCFNLANNELGTITDIRPFAEVAHAGGGIFFSDITQGVGKISVDVHALGIDLAAFSAHKLYGPKGVGALYIRSGEPKIELEPLIVGGGQERGLRAGTLNVPGIVGFGEACRIAKLEMAEESERIRIMRDRLEAALRAALPDIFVNGDLQNRLPNTSSITFVGVDARTLIRDMHDIAVSTKSACSSGQPGPSHVLKAIGLSDDDAYSTIRFSLGRFTTAREIEYAIGKVIESVRKLRGPVGG